MTYRTRGQGICVSKKDFSAPAENTEREYRGAYAEPRARRRRIAARRNREKRRARSMSIRIELRDPFPAAKLGSPGRFSVASRASKSNTCDRIGSGYSELPAALQGRFQHPSDRPNRDAAASYEVLKDS